VKSRALACAAAALLLAACRGTGERGVSGGQTRALAPANTPGALGPDIAAEVGARFAPSLEALQRAVTSGEDELARALIAHVDSLGPDPRVWQLTRAFERILDGRAAVKLLKLELSCEPEPLETLFPGAEQGAQAWRLVFRALNQGSDALELDPGPATLLSMRTDIGRNGTESSTQETRSFDRLKQLVLPPQGKAEVELARFFLAPPPGQLAVRLSFELELRSGAIKREGRELPAMHLNVQPARAARHAENLPEGTLTPDELLAASASLTDADALLELAVRTEPGPGGEGLVALEQALAGLARPRLELWVPSMRWLVGADLPTDVDGLRAWLRRRGETRTNAAPREKLVLPHEPRAGEPERN